MNLLWNADNADFQTQIKTDFFEKKSVLICVALHPFYPHSIWQTQYLGLAYKRACIK